LRFEEEEEIFLFPFSTYERGGKKRRGEEKGSSESAICKDKPV